MPVVLRRATASDAGFLAAMLLEAVAWSGEAPLALDELHRRPELDRYVRDWPRGGDVGVVATDGEGHPLAAGWARALPADEPGYGWVAEDVPELAMAVVASHRGQGIGRRVLEALVELVRQQERRAVSLSVADGNPAADLYRSVGFRPTGQAGGSTTMLLDLAGPAGG